MIKATLLTFATATFLMVLQGCSPQDSDAKEDSSPNTPNGMAPADGAPSPSSDNSLIIPDMAEGVVPPTPVLGSYLKATVISYGGGGEPISIGVIGMKGEERISEDKARYASTWSLDFEQPIPTTVTLTKSDDAVYDQILGFFGSLEQLKAEAALIRVSLQFRENENGSIRTNTVVSKLSELITVDTLSLR